MPPIFSVKKKDELKIKMYRAGIEQIKESGAKKMRVENITRAAGIGKGTFYHFFASKQHFVYEIICYSRDLLKERMNKMLEAKSKLSKAEARSFFYNLLNNSGSINLYEYLTPEDMNWLEEKLPEKYLYNPEKDMETTDLILKHIEGVRKDLDYRIVANFPKIIAIAIENKKLLHQDVMTENFKLIFDAMFHYIFDEDHYIAEEHAACFTSDHDSLSR